MARSVRKVSRASTKNQQKERKLSKKWWIVIASSIAAVVVGVTVGLIVYFATQEEEYVSDVVYFAEPVKSTSGTEVDFIKENHQTLVRYLKAETLEHMLVFAYDGAAFYADPLDEDVYNKQYTTLITRLADVQLKVNEAKAAGVNIELYVVDVNVDSRINVDIMYDTDYFGGLYSSNQTTFAPAFFYNLEGEFQTTVEIGGKDVTISTKSLDEILNSSIINTMNYINDLIEEVNQGSN